MSLTVYSKEQDEQNNKGVWKEFEGSRLKIAKWLNVAFISKFLIESKEALPNDDEKVSGDISRMIRHSLLAKTMAGTILTDWSNVKDDASGKDVEFTPELAEILLRNNLKVNNFVKKTSMELEAVNESREESVLGE